jgi:DNA-binding MarR family transcriptional regulator
MKRERFSRADYRSLAEFRYQIRRFLHFSEGAARAAGINPAQHQVLLVLKGIPPGTTPTIGNLAERLLLRHHSTVGLVDRLARRDLVRRAPSGSDRRRVLIEITAKGERLLERLSVIHRAELRSGGASLMRAIRLLIVPGGIRRSRLSP